MNGLESVPPASSSQPSFPLGGRFQLRVTAGTSLMALCRLPVFCPGALAPGLLRGSLLKGCLLGASLGQNHLSAKVLPYPEVLKQQEPHHQHRESRASSNGKKQRRQKVAAQNSEREQTAPRQGLQSTQTVLTGAWVCFPAAGSSSTGQYLLLTAWDRGTRATSTRADKLLSAPAAGSCPSPGACTWIPPSGPEASAGS